MLRREPLKFEESARIAELRARVAFARRLGELHELDGLLTRAKVAEATVFLPPLEVPMRCR